LEQTQAFRKNLFERQFAFHRAARQFRHALGLSFEARQFVNPLDGNEGAIAIEKDNTKSLTRMGKVRLRHRW